MLRSKAADCTVIGKGEAEWSLRDNIVGDSAAAASASVLGIRKRSNSSSYVRMYTTTSGLGSEGIERFFVTAIPPQQRHDEFARCCPRMSGINIKSLPYYVVASEWLKANFYCMMTYSTGWLHDESL